MKILIVSQCFWPEYLILNEVVSDLTKQGCEVVVLTGEPNYGDENLYRQYKVNKEKFAFYEGCQIIRAPIILRGSGSFRLVMNYLSFAISGSLMVLFKLKNKNFDHVFVFQSSPVIAAIPAIIYKKITKTPLTLWVQDLWPDTLSALGVIKNPFLLSLVGKLVSYIYKSSDTILCQSEGFIKSVANLAPKDKNISTLYNFSSDEVSKSPYVDIDLIKFTDETFDIVFAGNIGEAQDFSTIIESARIISKVTNSIRFIIVGDGRELKNVKSKINDMDLNNYFVFVGRHPATSMRYFFDNANVMLVTLLDKPNFSLTIPSKVQAYMSAGKPILAALNGVGAEAINEAKCGITVPSSNSGSLADAIILLSKKSDIELKGMGENGRVYYENNYSKNIFYKKFWSVLQK